jgi:hypothetical protein
MVLPELAGTVTGICRYLSRVPMSPDWHTQIWTCSKPLLTHIRKLGIPTDQLMSTREFAWLVPSINITWLNLIILLWGRKMSGWTFRDTDKHPVEFNYPPVVQRNIPWNSNYSQFLLYFEFLATCLNRYPNSTATDTVADNSSGSAGDWTPVYYTVMYYTCIIPY